MGNSDIFICFPAFFFSSPVFGSEFFSINRIIVYEKLLVYILLGTEIEKYITHVYFAAIMNIISFHKLFPLQSMGIISESDFCF